MVAVDAFHAAQTALSRNDEDLTTDDLLGQILSGEASVFAGKDAFMVCKLYDNEDGSKEAHCWIAGGDLKEITGPLRQCAETWARMNGATVATVSSDRGWSRVLKDYDGTDELRKVL